MYATITLREAINVLNKRYERILGSNRQVEVKYNLEQYMESYSDWGGFIETDVYYGVKATIKYNKNIGAVVARSTVTIGENSLNDDLEDELNKSYNDSDLVVDYVRLPRFSSNDGINYDKEVRIYFKEKRKKLVK